MGVHALDHVNIDTCRLDDTVQFYAGVLGLEVRPKPSGKPGVWLYAGNQAIVHVNVIESDRSGAGTGAVNHVAFGATDVAALQEALRISGHPCRVSERRDLGVTQLFTTDPNGVAVELNIADPV